MKKKKMGNENFTAAPRERRIVLNHRTQMSVNGDVVPFKKLLMNMEEKIILARVVLIDDKFLLEPTKKC